MGMQYDVLASKPLTSTGQMVAQNDGNIERARIKGIYVIPTANAGTITLRDGGASGPIKATINTLAASTAPTYMLVPGEGLLFNTNIHATISNVASVTVFYG
jgi:hypothetical protein